MKSNKRTRRIRTDFCHRAHTRLILPTSLSTRRSVRVHLPYTVQASLLTFFPVEPESAPTGMLGRGHYEASSMFTDDDKNVYLKFNWSFDIKKDW